MLNPDEYFDKNLKDILQPLFLALLSSRPDDVASYSINWLRKKGKFTSEGLTIKEKEELIQLRKEKSNTESTNIETSSSNEEEEDEEEENIERSPIKKDKPRNGICGEISDFSYNITCKTYQKTDDQKMFIKTSLINSFLFSSLDVNGINIIIDAMEEKSYVKNEIIIQQGDIGDSLFLVSSGELNCYKLFSSGEEKLVKKYFQGEIFGELSLLYNSPRAATVMVSSEKVTLWKLDRGTFSHIVKDSAIKKRRKYENFLKKVEIFSTMDPYEILQISDALIEMNFNKGDYIITEGELSDYFYIIEEGEAHSMKSFDDCIMIVKEYTKGDYFGELALIKDAPRAASVVTTSVSIFLKYNYHRIN